MSLLIALLAACSSSKATTDAPVATIDAPVVTIADAAPPPRPDALVQSGCSYNEVADSTNNTVVEQTGQTLITAPLTLCGSIAQNPPDANGIIDIDQMSFTIVNESDYLFQLSAPTLDSSVTTTIQLFDSMMNPIGSSAFAGGHAVLAAHLTSDTYTVEVQATGLASPTALVPYKIVITTDNEATRCMTLTTAADYVEANDGMSNTGNDMVDVSYSNGITETLTASTTDMPEPTGLTLSAGRNVRITGTSGNVAAGADDYRDRDTFAISMGEDANQLDIRINWPGSASDFDAFLFPAAATDATTIADVGEMITTDQTGPEYGALAVTPGENYWPWVGVYDDSNVVLPVDYDITVCSSNYTAP